MKEKLCFVSLNLESDHEKAQSTLEIKKDYKLPDGQIIAVNTPRFTAPEALFNPTLIKQGDDALGLHELAVVSVQDCDDDIRQEFYKNIYLSGGSTLFPGLPERL